MRSADYWFARALQREAEAHDGTADMLKRLAAMYSDADKGLTRMIDRIFQNYREYTGISEQEARELLSVQETAELQADLRKLYEETGDAETLAKLNAPAYGYRISCLQATRRAIESELDKLAAQEEKAGSKQLVKAYDDSYYKTMYDVLPEFPGTPVVPLSQGIVNQAIQNPWKGENYSSRVWKNRDVLASEGGKIIDAGVTAGKSIQQMTVELSDLMDVGAYAAARLLRTEVNRMHNVAALQSYRSMGMKEYTYLATLDARTCAVCGALDLKVFKVAEAQAGVNLPPMHPNDRCTIAPKVPGAEADGERIARDPETGKNYRVLAGTTYEEWRKGISEKYGADSLATAQKKYWNRKADAVQMKALRKLLGKDIPDALADFQNMKYNEPEKWEKLKQAVADQRIRNEIKAGKYPLQINEDKQARHILGDGYIKGRSYFTISKEEIQQLVNRYAGTGAIQKNRDGSFANKELIVTEKAVGVSINPDTGEKTPTNRFYIHYSKTGTHVVPTLKGADKE